MIIRKYVSDLLLSNMYILEEGGHGLVIDPCNNIEPGEGLCIDKILLTHEHYDHISGVNLWKEAYHTGVLCSKACADNICNPKKSLVRYFDVFCEIQDWVKIDEVPSVDFAYACTAEETFDDELIFEWQSHKVHLFTLPGHSKGSIGILVDDYDFFSGDSVMGEEKVELRLPGSSPKLWKEVAVPRLEMLPKDLCVHPGHFEEYRLQKGG